MGIATGNPPVKITSACTANKKPPVKDGLKPDSFFYLLATSNFLKMLLTFFWISLPVMWLLFISSVAHPCQIVLSVLGSIKLIVTVPSLTGVE